QRLAVVTQARSMPEPSIPNLFKKQPDPSAGSAIRANTSDTDCAPPQCRSAEETRIVSSFTPNGLGPESFGNRVFFACPVAGSGKPGLSPGAAYAVAEPDEEDPEGHGEYR